MAFPLELQFIRRAEAALGRALPSSYILKMCQENGGVAWFGEESFDLYPILDTTDRKRFARSCNDILRATATERSYNPVFPTDAVAIGNNGGGDQLVLIPDTDGRHFADAIYRWDHETDELRKVAEDFKDLMR